MIAPGTGALFGGSDPPIPNLVAEDVSIRFNHMSRPLSWREPIVPAPGDVTAVAAAGGSLPAGVYAYRVVARRSTGAGTTGSSLPSAEVTAVAEQIEKDLEAAGFDVLHDDREGLSPGVKFKDADLLGMPLRLTVGARGLKEGIVELRDRSSKMVTKVKPEEVVALVSAARDKLTAAATATGDS